MKKIRISYGDGLLISFLIGVAAGTILIQMTSSELKAGLSAFPFSAGGTNPEEAAGEMSLFLHLLKRRSFAALLGWLVGMTPYGAVCFLCLFAYAGLTMGVTVSVFTWQKGLTGIAYFLLSILPHSLFYGVVWLSLAVFAGKNSRTPKLILILCLFGICMIGAAMECWGFPMIWKWGK